MWHFVDQSVDDIQAMMEESRRDLGPGSESGSLSEV